MCYLDSEQLYTKTIFTLGYDLYKISLEIKWFMIKNIFPIFSYAIILPSFFPYSFNNFIFFLWSFTSTFYDSFPDVFSGFNQISLQVLTKRNVIFYIRCKWRYSVIANDLISSAITGDSLDLDTTGAESDASDGTSDKCPICLCKFQAQDLGNPESCDHCFCLECILEWSNNVNTCPIDRLVKSITIW